MPTILRPGLDQPVVVAIDEGFEILDHKPDMEDTKDNLCDTPDTIKLVDSSTIAEGGLPDEVLPADDKPITNTDGEEEGKDGAVQTRRLSCPIISHNTDGEVTPPKQRKLSVSSVKWADLSTDTESVTEGNASEADDQDELPKIPNTGSDEVRHTRDSGDEDKEAPRGLARISIPEEGCEKANENIPPRKMSTDDCEDVSANNGTVNAPIKAENPKLLSPSFPGLRKDSIDMYKKKKQNQDQVRVEPSEAQYPEGFSPWSDASRGLPGFPKTIKTDLPNPSILKRRSSGLRIDKEVTQSVFTILSGMYAMFLTILGAVLPIAELFAHEKHPLLFEIFYIYMYGGSILFLGYVYTYLLRSRAALKVDPPVQKKKRRKRRVSVDKVSSNTGSFYLRLGAVAFGIGSMIHSGLQFGDYFEVDALDPCRHAIFAVRPIVHLIFTFVQLYFVFMNSKMCINRYKVIARFGLMHMVATNICVWFNTIVEETLHQLRNGEAHHALPEDVLLNPHHHHTPTSTWTPLTDAHATNVSAGGHDHGPNRVLTTVTQLTTTAGHLIAGHIHDQNVTQDPGLPASVLPIPSPRIHYDCQTSQLMLTVLETVGPYLYPCSIEYSLICAGIVYTLWTNIGKRVMAIKSEDDSDDRARVHRLRVDCSNSSRGLFLGILILVGTIITMVVFFVLVKTPSYNESAVFVEYLSEITLFAVSIVAVVIAAMRMRYLRFNVTRDTDFEEVLILISLTGDYMFQMLSIVAAIFDGEQFASRLSITACLLGIIQSTIQTMFVLDGLRRCTRTPEQSRQKHGREYVTFLLITNIAMWCINTFEAERTVANPVQMHYYGALAWNILSHISIPLAIFFRFHSTVCLSNIWKRAWKSYS